MQLIQHFLKHGLIYAIANYLTRIISLLLLPFYTRVLTPQDYGIISLLSSVVAFMVPIFSLEFAQAIGIYIAESNSEQERKSFLSTAFWFLVGSNVLYGIFFLIFYHDFNLLKYQKVLSNNLILVTFLACSIHALFNYLQAQLLWRCQPILYSLISLLSVFTTICLTIYFVLKLKMGVLGVFTSSLMGNTLGSILALSCSLKHIGLAFDLKKLYQLLRFSLPLVASNLGYCVFLYSDQLVVNHFMGLHAAGIYGVACRFMIVVNLFINAIGSALPPLVYHAHKEPETKISLEKITRLFLLIAFMMVLGLLITGKEIILLFTTPQYLLAGGLIPILALSTFFMNMHFLTPGLNIAKKSLPVSILYVLCAGLNILVSISLVPRMGLYGAALSTLINSILFFLSYFQISQRYYRLNYQHKKIALALTFFVACYFLFYSIDIHFLNSLILVLMMKCVLLLMIACLFAWMLLTTSERRQLLNISWLKSKSSLELT